MSKRATRLTLKTNRERQVGDEDHEVGRPVARDSETRGQTSSSYAEHLGHQEPGDGSRSRGEHNHEEVDGDDAHVLQNSNILPDKGVS